MMLFLFLCINLFCHVYGRPNGGELLCNALKTDELRPGHDVDPQVGRSPYVLQVFEGFKPRTIVKSGRDYQVIIRNNPRGFLLRSIDDVTKEPIGTFTNVPTCAQAVNCGENGTIITHNGKQCVGLLSVPWTAPEAMSGKTVKFQLTAAENYATYWTGTEYKMKFKRIEKKNKN